MSEPRSSRSDLEDSLTIDRLCDRFEKAFRQSQQPLLAEYLLEVDARLRPRLFEQLLPLELELTSLAPNLADYLSRFADHAEVVRTTFEDLNLLDWKGTSIGPFQIEDEIARGGMGIIYLATDTRLERKVALKLLTRDRRTDTKWLRRFRKEAILASSLSHPNILTIYEIGEENGIPFIVSEFINGVTIRERMANEKLAVNEVVELASQVATGMAAAHGAGIIHRDLKVDNVMVRDDGLVKILDFGLAKTDDFHLPELSQNSNYSGISGTVPFMSPEQARGQKLSTATDVFSFGSLLYLMVTGELPFRGQTMSDVFAEILHGEPTPISTHQTNIPLELETLVLDCLRKNAEERPTFAEVRLVLDNIRSEQKDLSAAETESDLPVEAQTLNSPKRSLDTDLDCSKTTRHGSIPSPIRYAQSHDINIAWQEIGAGPIDIVFVMGWVSHLEWFWKDPSFAEFLQRLATFARVILFDKRGTGLSDKVPVNELPDLETRMDDVRAVMDAAGSHQAVLCGVSEGGPLCALFAATYPEKSLALTMIGSYSRRLWAEDYPWGPTAEKRESFLQEIASNWGGPVGIEERAPSMANNRQFREWWSSYLRMGASPGAAMALTKMNAQIDIRPILSSIQVPTLIIHRTGDRCLRIEEGRHLAERIPGAKFVELPGEDHLPFVGDSKSILDEIETFLSGIGSGPALDCVLATVMHIEIVTPSSTESQAEFKKRVVQQTELYRGQNFFDHGDSILVTFDGPVRSVVCARAISRLASHFGLSIKCGLETGTCNIDQSTIYGPAVDGARRVTELAPASSVVVTQTLRHLISGSTLQFEPLNQRIKSNSIEVELFEVKS